MKRVIEFLRVEWKTFVGVLALVSVVVLLLRTSEKTPAPVQHANIVPGERLGELRLGMDQAAIESKLGPPSAEQMLPTGLLAWHYPNRAISVVFERGEVVSIRARIQSLSEAIKPEWLETGAVMPDGPSSHPTLRLPGGHVVRDNLRSLDHALDVPLGQLSPAPGVSWQRYRGGAIAVLVTTPVEGQAKGQPRIREIIVVPPAASDDVKSK